MTGTLKIRYNRPTPLLAPLELVARNTGRDGRKVFAWGGIYHDGELTAEAEGIFIDVMQGKMLEIVRANANIAEARLVDPQWERLDGARRRHGETTEASRSRSAALGPGLLGPPPPGAGSPPGA